MRWNLRLFPAAVIAVTVLFAVGCSLSGPEVSIEERVDMFEDDLDANDWGSLYTHVHPDNDKRKQTKESEYWTSIFREEGDYRFSDMSGSGDTRTVTVGSNKDGSWDGEHLKFEMRQEEGGFFERTGWYINGITSEDGPVETVL